jgi:hypothetical protein
MKPSPNMVDSFKPTLLNLLREKSETLRAHDQAARKPMEEAQPANGLRQLAKGPMAAFVVKPAGERDRLLGGFMLGFASLAVIVVLTLAFGVRKFDDAISSARLLQRLGEAAFTAASVSIIEELLFRGAIFGAFRRVSHWRTALLISSAIYAILHFMKRAEQVGPVSWYSGLVILGEMLSGFANWQEVIPGFFNLTLAGALLALAYQRTGTLYFSIGLHAGWIFWRRAYAALTSDASNEHLWFWGTKTMTDGWLACLVLLAALLVLNWTLRKNEPVSTTMSSR